MSAKRIKIGVVAPGSRIEPKVAEQVKNLAATLYSERAPEIVFHPQCFLSWGHFAGEDAARLAAFLDVANDPSFDALWFGRGGYGSCRIAEGVIKGLAPAAKAKDYLGYSDAGSLLAALYKAGCARVAHGPMAAEITRPNGERAIARALAYLVDRAPETIEPSCAAAGAAPSLAFNITILSHLLGTALEPDFTGHVIMLEEVSEHMYRIDRALFHITSNPGPRRAAGLKLGRCSAIPPNEPDFGQTEEEVVRHWCGISGLPYLGRADIGHDVDNKIVPFGRQRTA